MEQDLVASVEPSVSNGASPSTGLSKPRDDQYYFAFTTFEVGGILFRVPRHPFEAESQIFRDMFSIPSDASADGNSDEKPLLLQGVNADDFRTFLKVLFHPAHAPSSELSQDDWIATLQLSHMWCCDRLFALAISKLDTLITDPVLKIVLAKLYGIKDWLIPAYFELATRTQPLALDEAHKLGMESVVKLNEVRESRYRWIIDDEVGHGNGNEEEIDYMDGYFYAHVIRKGGGQRKVVRARSPISRRSGHDVAEFDPDVRNTIIQVFNLG